MASYTIYKVSKKSTCSVTLLPENNIFPDFFPGNIKQGRRREEN
jgi:hypothetical protein